ncbi:hypothetical protein AYL99_03961 [Fonsecaea erecta]|uniref:Transcription factor domain-containing protein n=1 Tax=Fonsecaea erecta TaxID=1367422 RepID=A0A178ZPK2_9EURO|nr:hypothetical protein AYL99_03961 [Fonsecaea erecta]OAP61758.1 hypothetical protein AYL99_03961 [Fonsecaea erecta]
MNEVVGGDVRTNEPGQPKGASDKIQVDEGALGIRSLKPGHQRATSLRGTAESVSTHLNAQVTVGDNQPTGLLNHYHFLSISTADAAAYNWSQPDNLLLQVDGNGLNIDHDFDWDIPGLDDLLDPTQAAPEEDFGDLVWPIDESERSTEAPSDLIASFVASYYSPNYNSLEVLYRQPQSPSGSPEMIRHLFEQQTCAILSIKDDETKNPWRTLVWPLASGCPALYHALAAMTCLHMCRTQSQLRNIGLQHFQSGEKALVNGENNGNMVLEGAIATRLALGFAETWDHQRSSTGMGHINRAKVLIRQAASRHLTSRLAARDVSRLSFLANTCLYMDVIARLVCMEPQIVNNAEFMTACTSLSSAIPSEQQLDPLMGCAITLFPLIGQLAELVACVRRRAEKRNSPAIISRAIELRMAIEDWAPRVDSEGGATISLSITNSIQTAEAYRWASLLLLRQAVPELPWVHSIWELASKCLVFLATIPMSSRTIIVHTFPLMIAGCEAFEEDDRDWVRKRWDLMSKRMITGIVDRCREITIEVWRRRDEYETRYGIVCGKPPCRSASIAVGAVRDGSPSRAYSGLPRSVVEETTRFDTGARPRLASDFPDSAAFKKGIDPVTRAGFIDYTVRGDLHWLAVMKDWNWEVMLG